MTTRICSFDIGKKNFAFCIEEIDTKKITALKPKLSLLSMRYNRDGTPTEELQEILNIIFSEGKIVLYQNLDLTFECDQKAQLDPKTFYNMIDALDKYADDWENCDTIIIEEQMKTNISAVKLAQCCFTYFAIKYRSKTVLEFPSRYKTQILGAPRTEKKGRKTTRWIAMTKTQRKKWAVSKAARILKDRNETEALNIIRNARKKDDLADTFLSGKAYQFLRYVDGAYDVCDISDSDPRESSHKEHREK